MKPLRRYCIQNAPLKTLEKDSWHVKMLKSITNKENLRINGGSNKKVKTELLSVEKLHGKKFNHQNPCAFVALFLHFYIASRFSGSLAAEPSVKLVKSKKESGLEIRHNLQIITLTIIGHIN